MSSTIYYQPVIPEVVAGGLGVLLVIGDEE